MKPNIVFLDEYTLGGADLTRLHELGRYTGYSTTAPDEVADRCRDAEIVITNKVVMRRETLAALPGLRLICIAATGMNNIDLDAAAELGIAVRNAAGYSTHSVAETTLGAAIALRRHIVYYDRYVKSGAYSAAGQQFHFAKPTHQLYGSKWGVVGLGAIGHEVARLAAAFGCEVRYTSTSGAVREEPYPAVSLPELLGWADTVSVDAPLNDHTRGLIGAPELAVMKQSAILVNVARGGIVDEAALAEALDRGSVAGAALDVFSREPLAADNPLLGIREPDRLLLSPHNAWSPREAVDVLVGCIAENIEEFCKATTAPTPDERRQRVFGWLDARGIAYTWYEHPEAPTIEAARRYWRDDGSKHCKNLFFRNHKGNRHYLVAFDCEQNLAIHDLERRLRQGKLSFASEQRMERWLGLRPGSVSPFGLINDPEHHVHLFLDRNLERFPAYSFHPNDNRATVVVSRSEFLRYLTAVGNTYEFIELY